MSKSCIVLIVFFIFLVGFIYSLNSSSSINRIKGNPCVIPTQRLYQLICR